MKRVCGGGGYTVVLLLVTTEEKSVGYTVFLHLNEGRKECGYTVFLHLNEGRKECGGTLFFSILTKVLSLYIIMPDAPVLARSLPVSHCSFYFLRFLLFSIFHCHVEQSSCGHSGELYCFFLQKICGSNI